MKSKTVKILIVDDDTRIIVLLSSLFSVEFEVISAKNGIEALEKILVKRPDIVISDVMMPGMTGFELCKRIKESEMTAHIPVVLLTARDDVESELEGLGYGADQYIAKPFHLEIVKKTIKNMLETKRKMILVSEKNEDSKILYGSSHKDILEQFKDTVSGQMGNPDLSIQEIADGLHITIKKLQRVVKKQTGLSPKAYLTQRRLYNAKSIIESTTKTISEAAFETGFSNLSHFSNYFKSEFGLLPSEVVRKSND